MDPECTGKATGLPYHQKETAALFHAMKSKLAVQILQQLLPGGG